MWANTSVRGHCMQVHVLVELMLSPKLQPAVVPTATYGELHPGSSRVPVCLCNLSAHTVEMPTKAWLDRLFLPTKYHWLTTQPGSQEKKVIKPQKDGSRRLWTSRVSQSGLNQRRNKLGSCCSNGSTCLHTVIWTWIKLL